MNNSKDLKNDSKDLRKLAAIKEKEAAKANAEARCFRLNVKLKCVPEILHKNKYVCGKILLLADDEVKKILSEVINSQEFNDIFDKKHNDILPVLRDAKKKKADRRKASIYKKSADNNDCTENKKVDNAVVISYGNKYIREDTAVSTDEKSCADFSCGNAVDSDDISTRNEKTDETIVLPRNSAVQVDSSIEVCALSDTVNDSYI